MIKMQIEMAAPDAVSSTYPIFLTLIFLTIIFFIYSIIGFLAKKKGRSFWRWTLIPFMFLIIPCVLWSIYEKFDIPSIIAVMIFVFPPTFFTALIAILISGKTKKQKEKEIQEAEELRLQVREKYKQEEEMESQTTSSK